MVWLGELMYLLITAFLVCLFIRNKNTCSLIQGLGYITNWCTTPIITYNVFNGKKKGKKEEERRKKYKRASTLYYFICAFIMQDKSLDVATV